MSDRTKKILLIVVFILAVLLFAFGLYYLFFRPLFAPPAPPVVIPTPAPITGLPVLPPALNIAYPPTSPLPVVIPPGIPGAPAASPAGPTYSYQATGGITAFQTLENERTQNPTLATNGQDLIYYNKNNGSFYRLTPDGQKTSFSDAIFKNVQKITWSNNTQKAILEYPDGSNIVYDFNQKRSLTLPAQWKDFTFSPDSQKIAFKDMKLDPENRYLAVANADGTNYREIERLGDKDADVYVTWSPTDTYGALYRAPLDGDRSEVYPIGFNGENFKKFTIEGRDPRFNWSPNGNKLLYSVYNSSSDFNPTLWVINMRPELIGTGRNKFEIKTWADKCTFASESTVYCAVPETLETGTGFLPNLADNTPDNFYKIDLQKGTQELIAQPLFPTTVDKMIVSEDAKTLYWLEKNSAQLKEMKL
jgi:hypothetical protein